MDAPLKTYKIRSRSVPVRVYEVKERGRGRKLQCQCPAALYRRPCRHVKLAAQMREYAVLE